MRDRHCFLSRFQTLPDTSISCLSMLRSRQASSQSKLHLQNQCSLVNMIPSLSRFKTARRPAVSLPMVLYNEDCYDGAELMRRRDQIHLDLKSGLNAQPFSPAKLNAILRSEGLHFNCRVDSVKSHASRPGCLPKSQLCQSNSGELFAAHRSQSRKITGKRNPFMVGTVGQQRHQDFPHCSMRSEGRTLDQAIQARGPTQFGCGCAAASSDDCQAELLDADHSHLGFDPEPSRL